MELKIGLTYKDSEFGRLTYIGRIGYELNLPTVSKKKGRNVFVALDVFKLPVFMTLKQDELKDLIPLS
jgi:hypothetical protein